MSINGKHKEKDSWDTTPAMYDKQWKESLWGGGRGVPSCPDRWLRGLRIPLFAHHQIMPVKPLNSHTSLQGATQPIWQSFQELSFASCQPSIVIQTYLTNERRWVSQTQTKMEKY